MSWVINQAIDRFLGYEEWYPKEVKDGLAEVERGEIAADEELALGQNNEPAHQCQ